MTTLTIEELLATVSDDDIIEAEVCAAHATEFITKALHVTHPDIEDFDPEGIVYEMFMQCAAYLQENCGFTLDDMIEDVTSVSDLSPDRVLH